MNLIFYLMVLISFVAASYGELSGFVGPEGQSSMQLLTAGAMNGAETSVTLALDLIGVMALFLGLIKVAEEAGALTLLARLIRPLMTRLFPEVPPDHPAMGAMILNLSANALGLGNAATPFGIRAMVELEKLNPNPGTATNAMALFLAINTSSVTILPTGVIAVREIHGSLAPAGIIGTTLFATLCSTSAAIIAAKTYCHFYPVPSAPIAKPSAPSSAVDDSFPLWASLGALGLLVGLIPLSILYGDAFSPWVIPCIILGFLSFGYFRGVAVYEVFVEGAKEGFTIATLIIPYLVAVLSGVGMLKASGAMGLFIDLVGPYSSLVGIPAEALPMALMRPLSGSGAGGILQATLQESGPDSYVGYLVSTFQGSTETTFYVIAVYFGAAKVKHIRHALWTALTADVVGIFASVAICSYLFS